MSTIVEPHLTQEIIKAFRGPFRRGFMDWWIHTLLRRLCPLERESCSNRSYVCCRGCFSVTLREDALLHQGQRNSEFEWNSTLFLIILKENSSLEISMTPTPLKPVFPYHFLSVNIDMFKLYYYILCPFCHVTFWLLTHQGLPGQSGIEGLPGHKGDQVSVTIQQLSRESAWDWRLTWCQTCASHLYKLCFVLLLSCLPGGYRSLWETWCTRAPRREGVWRPKRLAWTAWTSG